LRLGFRVNVQVFASADFWPPSVAASGTTDVALAPSAGGKASRVRYIVRVVKLIVVPT
jgi:hypothetical protein